MSGLCYNGEMNKNPNTPPIQAFLEQIGLQNSDEMFDKVFDHVNKERLDPDAVVGRYESDISNLLETYREEVRAWIRAMALMS